VGKQPWDDVERRFLDMGFDRAFPPGTRVETALAALAADFALRDARADSRVTPRRHPP